MDEEDFRAIYCNLIEHYFLSPQVAAELLQIILAALQNSDKSHENSKNQS